MVDQPGLFDPPTDHGDRLRDEAVTRAETNADPRWWSMAWAAVRAVAQHRTEWTTDDVWQALDDMGAPPPPEPRAMGAITRRAARSGIAVATDRTALSVRPQCHRRPVRVWRSL